MDEKQQIEALAESVELLRKQVDRVAALMVRARRLRVVVGVLLVVLAVVVGWAIRGVVDERRIDRVVLIETEAEPE